MSTSLHPSSKEVPKADALGPTHYKDWPNDAGFNAETEQRTPIPLPITGTIPAYAAGTLFRTGPGSHKLTTKDGEFACSHWFDGFAHLYRFELIVTPAGDCKVVYSSRRQVDKLIERVRKTGRLDGITFGQKRDPCDTFFQKIKSTFEPSLGREPGLMNVGVSISANVAGIPSSMTDKSTVKTGNLVSFTDASIMKTHDPETLAPLGVTDQTMLHRSLSGPLSSAHPEFDPQTGDVYNYNLAFGPTPTYRIFCTSAATGKTSILATLSGKDAKVAYIHSFFITENFLVLCIWPAHFAAGGAKVLWTRNLLDALADFDPSAKTKWIIIDRRHSNGVVAKFESHAMFAFHTVNAYEEVGKDGRVDIVCDLVQHRTVDILKRFYYESMVSTSPGAAKGRLGMADGMDGMARYKLSGIPSGGKPVTKEMGKAEEIFIMSPTLSGELPTINPAYTTKKHHYVYGLCDRRQSSFLDGIVKMDMETQTSVLWSKKGHTPGEPIFVADPEKAGEDDGVVLSAVLDGETGHSYLLVLDAKSWVEVGRAEVPVAVGFGFHGAHVKGL
ncbi:carotenoid cleavage dioxygenase 1 [Mycena sp. CBHHK59/15]|nr:carotenoid cleavage dioxygenase 1 [Mycena sp. CBHHK59/15]